MQYTIKMCCFTLNTCRVFLKGYARHNVFLKGYANIEAEVSHLIKHKKSQNSILGELWCVIVSKLLH